jgi:hypothetical protein
MTRRSPSDQNQTGKPEPKTPMGGNQQVPQAAGNPRFRNPGLDPSPDPKIVVKAINPPVTPDQVVGMAEMPSAATLDLPKIQNIKIPPVKNKTIQGHLKAIEAKMTATEKLMKDVVKLQKLQIITEKELFERKRELYQNTFEEYLLDKTVDFENPDDPGGANSIKKGPGGFGFPFGGGRRRRKGRPPGGGSGAGAAATAGAATTAAERMADGQASGLPNLGTDYKKQEQDAIKKAEEFRRQQEQKTGVPAKGKPVPDQDEAEAVPETPVLPERAPLRVPPGLPILDPKFVPPFDIPDVITQAGVPPTPPVVTIPGYDMRVKTHQQDLADAIETYIENNPGSEFEVKLGRGARVDTGHLIKKKDGKIYIHEPLTQEQLVLIGAGNFLNLSGWMPVVPRKTGRRTPTVPGTSLPTVTPTRKAPTAAPVPVPGTNTISPGPGRTQQPAQPLSPVTARGARLGGDRRIMRQSRPVNSKEAQMQVNRDMMEAEMLGQDPRFVKMLMDQGFNFSAGSNVMPRTRKMFQSKRQPGVSFETNMNLSDFLGAGGGFGPRPLSTKEILQQMKQSSFDQYSSPIGPMPKASGGIGDIDLYSSKSLNYFRGMSSKIMPMADGGFMGWFNKGVNTRIPNEAKAKFGNPFSYFQKNPDPTTLFGDDALQRGQSNKNFKAGKKPSVFGRPDRAFGLDIVDSVKQRRLVTVPASQGGPMSGPTPITREIIKRPIRASAHPLIMLAEMIVNELINPQPTAVYDQVTGPNAYYNAPGYKGPMPSQNLENAQSSMMSGSDPKVEIKPLPPDYIKIPAKKKAPDFVGTESPDIEMRSSVFTRSSTHID